MNCLQTPGVMIGQAAIGLLSALMAIFIQTITKDPIRNGRLFFGFAFVWTVVSIGIYIWLWGNRPLESENRQSDQLLDDEDQLIGYPLD